MLGDRYELDYKKFYREGNTFVSIEKENGLGRNAIYSAFKRTGTISENSKMFPILKKYLKKVKW